MWPVQYAIRPYVENSKDPLSWTKIKQGEKDRKIHKTMHGKSYELTLIELAILYQKPDIINLLIEAEADTTKQNNYSKR